MMPSVTGKKAQVPYEPSWDTVALALMSVAESLLTKHSKIGVEPFLRYGVVGAHPALVAKA